MKLDRQTDGRTDTGAMTMGVEPPSKTSNNKMELLMGILVNFVPGKRDGDKEQ